MSADNQNTVPGVEPIALHPQNRHYFLFRGKPTVLVTAGEHYGAVLNLDFDYATYLDTLGEHGLNLTRLFSGSYVEAEDHIGWMKYANVLAPRPNRYAAPWARSDQPGCAHGGNRFDLDRWDEGYFGRLKDFVAQAGARGVVVEVVLFCNMYSESHWRISPLNAANNVNGVGTGTAAEFTTLAERSLVERQTTLVEKMVAELNAYDNVYFEICNEPPNARERPVVEWHDHHIETIVRAESRLPHRHMIAVDYDREYALAHVHPAVSVVNTHYTWGTDWIGAMELLDGHYEQDRALALDETSGFPHHMTADEVRVEAWEALTGGCAVYDHLSWGYTPDDPGGKDEQHRKMLTQLAALKGFIGGLDFVRMRAAPEVIAGGVPEGAQARCLAEPGRQYAVYVHHGERDRKYKDTAYAVTRGSHRLELRLAVEEGAYDAEWVAPETASVLAQVRVRPAGGTLALASPEYAVDVALRLRRTDA